MAEAVILELSSLLREQMTAAAKRDEHLTALVENTMETVRMSVKSHPEQRSSIPPPTQTAKQISVERPTLLSSSSLSEFTAWEEAWRDYSICQHLPSQSRETRVSALRQAFDEDLRRFLREGIISVPTSADTTEIISAVQKYIRRQRNPLLDRIEFYARRQTSGESFDAFYTALRELFGACDFPNMSVCQTCTTRMCSTCPDQLRRINDDILRDRILIGIRNDDTRHKLLAESDLTLETTVKICRAEEAASHTSDGIPPSQQAVMATRKRSSYQKRKSAPPREVKLDGSHKKQCPNCGRTAHTKSPCPAATRVCNGCQRTGHFQSMCRSSAKKSSGASTSKIGQLKLQRTTVSDRSLIVVDTTAKFARTPVPLKWLPDTGSDVDAIGLTHLKQLGGSVAQLEADPDIVTGVNGHTLTTVGKIQATLCFHHVSCNTTIHVYEDLTEALLSRSSLTALGILPTIWPSVSRVTTAATATSADINRIRSELLHEFADVFDENHLPPMQGPAMDIRLQPDATPVCVHHARPIPYAYRDQVKRQLDDMVDADIIEPVTEPSEWCHPIVVVDKPGTTEKRLTVDFKKLNSQVLRPSHPTRSPRDAISDIQASKFFTKLDARHGYWQIPLSEEARSLTTFITPWGRYRYLRNPQGLISAGDEYNRRMDGAFDRIDRFRKIVDDCLIYDDEFEVHLQRVRQVLTCAREHGLTLSAPKFVFAVPQVTYCGYVLNQDGWTVDQAKTSAIHQFPIPGNRTDLRSFLGLVNQCTEFSPRLAELTSPLRGLLKTPSDFVWTSDHTNAFDATKAEILSLSTLSFFHMGGDLRLETDASVLKGLGFVLWQKQRDVWRIIQCGSRYLSEAEARYAVIELELLGVVWAVHKCKVYLSGTQFSVVTDHRSLVPILNSYSLDQIENPRLLRLMLKLRSFQLTAFWRKGADNAFADALSRNPVDLPCCEEQFGEDSTLSCRSLRICISRMQDDPQLDLRFAEIRNAALADQTYQSLVDYIQTGFPTSQRNLPTEIAAYWNGREHLSVDNGVILKGNRIVVPESLRESIVRRLHAAHQGIVRMKARARRTVYWPGLTKMLEAAVRQCLPCREHQRSQTKEPTMNDRLPSLPFELTSADLFSCQGWDFLAYIDRLTGWPCVARTGRTTSSHDVIVQLRRWFSDVGVPTVIYTDGGPQFASRKFAEFCRRWGVRHVKSSPHYPASNGHAEAGVKAMKTLILKTTTNGNLDLDAFRQGLLEWRNTPGADGRSPADKLFGKPLQSFVFAHHRSFAPAWKAKARATDNLRNSQVSAVSDVSPSSRFTSARPLHQLKLGTHVDLQDPRTKLWSQRGIIVAIGTHRDYLVKLPSGRILWRNRRFLRPYIPPIPTRSSDTRDHNISVVVPRRSDRSRRQPERLNITSTRGQSYM